MLDELVAELARLYGDIESARRIVTEAGIHATYIEFGGAAIDLWHRIVYEAEKQRKVPDLVRVARNGYETNPTLQQIWGHYRYAPRVKDSESLQDRDGDSMTSRYIQGNGGDNPRLGERMARIEERQISYQASVSGQIAALNDRLDKDKVDLKQEIKDLTAAIAAKPIPSINQNRLINAVVGIGVAIGLLVVALLLLWVRLGSPT